jgi:hypothetical protein
MAAKKQTLSDSILDAVLNNVAYVSPAAVYAALYTVAPTATTAGTEVTTGGGTLYNRVVAVFFTPVSGGATSNNGSVTFPVAGASWGTVVAAAICESGTPGTNDHLYFGALGTPKTVGIGDQLSFANTALSVTES